MSERSEKIEIPSHPGEFLIDDLVEALTAGALVRRVENRPFEEGISQIRCPAKAPPTRAAS